MLAVPYLAQTPQLCGGAALAMVLRYWGDTSVLPEDFSSLVNRREGGIRTSALTEAARARGWQATATSATDGGGWTLLERTIARGQPVIALIEERPGTYHYVVTTGITSERVIVHDPASAPFRAMDRDDFERRWRAADHWLMIVLPAPGRSVSLAPVDVAASVSASVSAPLTGAGPCARQIASYIDTARSGQLDAAATGFARVIAACPTNAQGWSEFAGVRFLQRRYGEAATLAERAQGLSPGHRNTLDVLAASRYMQGQFRAALEAWNQMGEPRIDTVSVQGLTRTSHSLVIAQAGFKPRSLLTADEFVRAERRLADLPLTSMAEVRFQPRANGTAGVTLVTRERSVFPRGAGAWGLIALNAAFRRELGIDIVSPSGQAEAFSVSYRWKTRRSRTRFSFAAPSPGAVPGVIAVDGLWEEQHYRTVDSAVSGRVARRRVGVHVGDWARGWLRWQGGSAWDRFGEADTERFISGETAVTLLDPAGHIQGTASVGRWTNTSGGPSFAAGRVAVGWRSRADTVEPRWQVGIGMVAVSKAAPLPLWPVASSSDTRGALLRAHALFDDGIVRDDILGRRLVHGGAEYERPVLKHSMVQVGVAGFVDLARVSLRRMGDSSPLHADIGAGVRLSGPRSLGQLRIDLAHGLRDGRTALSAGLVTAWGR